MSNITVKCKCPICGTASSLTVNEQDLDAWRGGKKAQDAFPTLSTFDRELLITGMCHACQSNLYNIPMPGVDWGEMAGYCPECNTPLWVSRNRTEGSRYLCPTCGNSFNENELSKE